jgi:ATP:ADP antiporter, AAA family
MSASLTGSFDVRQGEGALVARSTITLFGLIAAHTMLETARDALFLGELTAARLPLVYVLLAGLSLVVARANTRFVEGFGRRNVLVITLLAAAYGTILLFLIPSSKAAIFSLYVWSALLGTVMVVQFWMYCGHLFTVAQGSRLFGLVTAGGVLGAVTGAATSVLLLRLLPVKALLLVSAGIFLATALHLTGLHVDAPDAPSKRRRSDPEEPRGFGRFQHHPYVVRIAVLIAISTAAVLVTDYLFKSAAVAYYERDQLGGFFATYYAILNAVALGVQVFLASRLVDRAGVIAAFVVLPLLLMAGGLGTVLIGGSFAAVLLTKGADGSLRHSLHRITTELLWLPVPDQVRASSKAFVDTVVMRAAQALAAGSLLIIGMFDVDGVRILSAIVAGLALLWIGFAFALRGPYLDLFRNALNRSAPSTKRIQLDLNSVEVVVEKLSSRDKVEALAAIDLLAASHRSRLIPALILYHEHEEVLIRALDVIAARDRRDWIPLAERLLDHRSPKVRVAALKALASQLEDKKSIEGRMLDISPYVRAHAAFWLAHLDRSVAPIQDAAVAQIMEMGEWSAGTDAQVGLLEAIRAGGDGRWIDVISTLAASEDPQVMEAAVLAIEKVRSEGFIPLLIQRLGVREGRDVVREAIVGLGEPALIALEKALSDPSTPHQIARHIPRTISRFGTQHAADILAEKLFTTESGAVRFKVLRGLGRMVVERPVRVDRDKIEKRLAMELQEYLRLTALAYPIESNLDKAGEAEMSGRLLVGLLSNKMDQALERIFRLLQIAHRSEDIRSAWFAARSGDKRMRAQAHEFLSALTLTSVVPENREMLRIVIDDLPVEERIKRAAEFVPNAPVSHRTAVLRLLEDDDEALAGIATYHGLHIGGLKNEVINLSKGSPLWKQVKAMLEGISGLREVPSVA